MSLGRSGYGCDTIVVGVDTSGAIGQQTLARFFKEMVGILEDLNPRVLRVVWCDAKVHCDDEIRDMSDLSVLTRKGAPGGGGTRFTPVFENRLQPDALVYLIDGPGSFPQEAPKYPVIWGNIATTSKYPFGDVIEIPVSAVAV